MGETKAKRCARSDFRRDGYQTLQRIEELWDYFENMICAASWARNLPNRLRNKLVEPTAPM